MIAYTPHLFVQQDANSPSFHTGGTEVHGTPGSELWEPVSVQLGTCRPPKNFLQPRRLMHTKSDRAPLQSWLLGPGKQWPSPSLPIFDPEATPCHYPGKRGLKKSEKSVKKTRSWNKLRRPVVWLFLVWRLFWYVPNLRAGPPDCGAGQRLRRDRLVDGAAVKMLYRVYWLVRVRTLSIITDCDVAARGAPRGWYQGGRRRGVVLVWQIVSGVLEHEPESLEAASSYCFLFLYFLFFLDMSLIWLRKAFLWVRGPIVWIYSAYISKEFLGPVALSNLEDEDFVVRISLTKALGTFVSVSFFGDLFLAQWRWSGCFP